MKMVIFLMLFPVFVFSQTTATTFTLKWEDSYTACQHDWITISSYYKEYPDYKVCLKCGWKEPHCDHIYVEVLTPDIGRDSFELYRKPGISLTYPIYTYPPDKIQVKANKPCICVKCHHQNKCY